MIKNKIMEFSEFLNESRSSEIIDISRCRDNIFEHFMKIFIYVESEQYVKGWINEIEHFSETLYDIKKGKPFEYEIYYNNLIYKMVDDYGNIIHKNKRIIDSTHKSILKACSSMIAFNDDIETCVRLYEVFIRRLYNEVLNKKEYDAEKTKNILYQIFEIVE